MKQLIFFSLLMILGFNFQGKSQPNRNSQNHQTSDAVVALIFMNDYKRLCDSHKEQIDIDQWIKNNALLTDKFKSTYKKILTDAYKDEPEVGLDFDPILDAQYYPDKGFKIFKYDSGLGYVSLVGIDQKDFTVTIKIIFQNNKWLIDGAGIINIPKEMQRKT